MKNYFHRLRNNFRFILLLIIFPAARDVCTRWSRYYAGGWRSRFGHFLAGYVNGISHCTYCWFIKFNFENGFHIQFNNWMYYGGIYRYKIANYPGKAVLVCWLVSFNQLIWFIFAFKIDFSQYLVILVYCCCSNSNSSEFFGLCSDSFKYINC